MTRHVFAVVGGYLLWSVLWLGYNAVLKSTAMLPADATQPVRSMSAVLALLVGSVVISLVVGWAAAAINGSAAGPTILALAVLLLATGIFFEAQNWALLPVWYHLVFLALIVPAVLLGARFCGA